MATTSSSKKNLREFLKLLLFLLVIFALLEGVCYLVIRGVFPHYREYPYNRIVSGSTLFYNAPGYNYGGSTIKNDASEKNLVIDSNGFVSNSPITFIKPQGVIRVFLMGGSAMFGSGQSKPYDQVKPYPSGNYSWEASIAGCLQRKLDSLCPGKKFEVINAACSGFTTKQSLSLYIEKVCRFSPDYIIQMDGMNDLGNMISGDQTDFNAVMFNNYLELTHRNKNLVALNTIKLVQLLQGRIAEKRSEKLSNENMLSKINYNPSKYTVEKAQQITDKLDEQSVAYLRLLNRYSAVLNADSVHFIYLLQPLLNRVKTNKKLSKSEQLFAQRVDPITGPEKSINQFKLENLHGQGLSSYDVLHLMLLYYFDMGFSDALKKTITSPSNQYIDGNEAIQNLNENVEFFTDYCHLTPFANNFIADLFAKNIVDDLAQTPDDNKRLLKNDRKD